MKSIGLIASLILLMATGASAADFEWPAQMNVGGFQITDIRGTVSQDGSGTATGTIQLSSLGNASVRLTRSSSGDVKGTSSIDTRGVRGSFTLSDSGLRGQGTVDCSSKSISNASINISPRGEASGRGKLDLGRLSASVDFNVSSSGCSFKGATSAGARVDTAIASYKLDGNLSVQSGGAGITGTMSGRVERTSKVANQVTSFNISNTSVDISSGQCTVNVGGVSVTFSLF